MAPAAPGARRAELACIGGPRSRGAMRAAAAVQSKPPKRLSALDLGSRWEVTGRANSSSPRHSAAPAARFSSGVSRPGATAPRSPS